MVCVVHVSREKNSEKIVGQKLSAVLEEEKPNKPRGTNIRGVCTHRSQDGGRRYCTTKARDLESLLFRSAKRKPRKSSSIVNINRLPLLVSLNDARGLAVSHSDGLARVGRPVVSWQLCVCGNSMRV